MEPTPSDNLTTNYNISTEWVERAQITVSFATALVINIATLLALKCPACVSGIAYNKDEFTLYLGH